MSCIHLLQEQETSELRFTATVALNYNSQLLSMWIIMQRKTGNEKQKNSPDAGKRGRKRWWWRALDNASVFLLCLSVCSWVFLFSLVFLRALLFSGKSLLPCSSPCLRPLCTSGFFSSGYVLFTPTLPVFFPGEMKKMNSVYWNDAVFGMGTAVCNLVL